MVSYQNCSSGVAFEAGETLASQGGGTLDSDDSATAPPGTGSTIGTPGVAVSCPAPKVSVANSCICPAGSNDVGNACLTCSAFEKFNPMTLKCDALTVACPAGETYDGYKCVAISATCDSYVEVPSSKFVIPPRNVNADGKGKVCYYVKLVSKVQLAPSESFSARRSDIVSRNHGGEGNAPPYVLASKLVSFILQGDREVVLAGDSFGGADIYVDNYFLVEVLYPGLTKSNLWASGTADALPYSGKGVGPIMVDGQPVDDWHAFGEGGTSTFKAINMYSHMTKNKEILFRGSSLDCGSVGESSDVYLLFR